MYVGGIIHKDVIKNIYALSGTIVYTPSCFSINMILCKYVNMYMEYVCIQYNKIYMFIYLYIVYILNLATYNI